MHRSRIHLYLDDPFFMKLLVEKVVGFKIFYKDEVFKIPLSKIILNFLDEQNEIGKEAVEKLIKLEQELEENDRNS